MVIDLDRPLLQTSGSFGPYRVQSLLNRGGMGAVYLVTKQGEPNSRYALKVIRKEVATPRFLARFETERALLRELHHPHIVKIVDGAESAEGVPYLVMEFVEGEPVTAYCEAKQLDVRARAALFAKVCRAVQYLHERGFVHRDLKPSNIFVTPAGEPKLLDFGIAKSYSDRGKSTSLGLTLYTPAYASPEQIQGRAARPTSDIYSLGVVLYQLLSGKALFPDSVYERIVSNRPDPVGVPALEPALARALCADPQQRYQMAGEMARDLERYG